MRLQNKYNQSSNELTAEDWFQKGINAAEIGDYNNSILYYQKAIEINPDFAEAYFNMVSSYANKGNFEKSVKCAKQAARLGLKEAQELLIKNGIPW